MLQSQRWSFVSYSLRSFSAFGGVRCVAAGIVRPAGRLDKMVMSAMSFPEMAECGDGGPGQHPDIRQGRSVREHHARSTLAGNADLHGEPAVVGAGIRARRVATEAHHAARRSEEHTSELQSPCNLVCRLLLEKKK